MKKFSPQMFLSALGAGGIAVSGFAFLNYTVEHGKRLITYAQLHAKDLTSFQKIFYGFFESYMVIFSLIHFIILAFLIKRYLAWKKTAAYKETLENPTTASSLLILYIVLFMSLNVFIGVIRYFIPFLSDNFQAIMPYGFAAWLILWLFMMWREIGLLSNSLSKKYDFDKINFSWMLHPFALGIATVTGTGIAALATSRPIADAAAFISMISFTMSLFLLIIKSTSLFRNYFSAESLPEKQYLPSMLNFVPIMTVLGISIFRYGHYFERNFQAHLGPFFAVITMLVFAFETWYLFFGIYLLRDYLKKDVHQEFHPSQWSLICPLVAYAVMGSFIYFTFLHTPLFSWVISTVTVVFIMLYAYLLIRQGKQWVFEKTS